MADILKTGIAALGQWLKNFAAQPVTYSRATDSVDLLASYGSKLLKIDDGMGGIRIEMTDMDFVLPAADFHFADGAVIEPQRGDLVYMTIDDQVQAFEVLPYGSEPAWRWCDPYHTNIRIHTKHVDTEQFYRWPMAIVIDIADAVVARLNGATLSQVFEAERHYVPVHEIKALVDLTVSVVPRTLDGALLARSGRNLYTFVIDIDVQRTIGRGAMSLAEIKAAADPLMTLAEEMADLFDGKPLTIPIFVATCTNVANAPIFAAEPLDEMRIFTSVLSLTFKLGAVTVAGMFSIDFKAAKEGFFDREKVLTAMDKATVRSLSKFGAFVRTRARSSIRKRKKSSKPGQAPSSHVGLLKNLIFFSYDAGSRSVVIGPTLINKPTGAPVTLEYGGDTELEGHQFRMRGGKRVFEKTRRQVTIAQRPYMNPAFETEKSKAAELWKNSIK